MAGPEWCPFCGCLTDCTRVRPSDYRDISVALLQFERPLEMACRPETRSRVSSSTRLRVPYNEGTSPQYSVVGCSQQMASDTEEILGDPMYRQEPLRLSHGFEPPHASLPLPGRLVEDFRPIVRVLACVVSD